MALTVQHAADASSNYPSPSIWGKVNIADAILHGHGKYFWDDFHNFGGLLTTTVGQYSSSAGNWLSYQDSSDTILPLATNDLGVIQLATDSTDNDEVWMMPGSAASVFATAKTRANGGATLAFEARVAFGQITTTSNYFVGMSEEGLAAADTAADSGGAMASKDLIGFNAVEAASSTLNFVWRKAGQALVVGAAGVQTLAAATFYKLGFVIDMKEPSASKRIKIYVDGVEQSTYGTDTQLEAATFPSGEELHALIGLKNNNAAIDMSVDWVRMYQSR